MAGKGSSQESALDNDAVVSAGDQSKICRFSCLHQLYRELEAQLAIEKDTSQGLKDASDEVLMGGIESCEPDDDSSLPDGTSGKTLVKIGDAYMDLEEDEALEFLKQWEDHTTLEIQRIRDQMQKADDEMQSLKKVLYEKFGDQIQLEA